MVEGGEPKTTCVTRYDSYEFLAMPFDLTNASTIFCTVMNKVLQPFLGWFIVDHDVQLDAGGAHRPLETSAPSATGDYLNVKREKWVFIQEEIPFLGHIIGWRTGMDGPC